MNQPSMPPKRKGTVRVASRDASETQEFESLEDLTISPDLEVGEQSLTSPAERLLTQSTLGALGMRGVVSPPASTLREPPMQGPQDDCSGPRSPELSRNDPA